MKTFKEFISEIRRDVKRTLIRHKHPSLMPEKIKIHKAPVIKKIYNSSLIGRKSPLTIAPIKNIVAQRVQIGRAHV